MSKDPVEIRLNRVEGQIKAIKRMYASDKECDEIVQQVQAARAALGKVASMLFSHEVARCAQEGNVKKLKSVVERTFRTI